MPKLKSEPLSPRDRIRDASPRYADLLDKHDELSGRAEELRAEIGGNVVRHVTTTDKGGNITGYRVEESLGAEAGRNHSWASEAPTAKPAPIVPHAGAVNLLGDLAPQSEPEAITPPAPRPSWSRKSRYDEIGRELESIHEALKMLSPAIEAARKEHSMRQGAARADAYGELVEGLVDAAKAFGDKLIEHFEFINQARLEGIERRHFKALNLQSFDFDIDHPLRRLIVDAVEKKHVGPEELPNWKMPTSIDLLHL